MKEPLDAEASESNDLDSEASAPFTDKEAATFIWNALLRRGHSNMEELEDRLYAIGIRTMDRMEHMVEKAFDGGSDGTATELE
jgi:hypothetical protein